MKRLFDLIDGYKTYLAAIVVGALVTLRILGVITNDTFDLLLALVGGTGLAALRHAMKKNGGKP